MLLFVTPYIYILLCFSSIFTDFLCFFFLLLGTKIGNNRQTSHKKHQKRCNDMVTKKKQKRMVIDELSEK